MNGSVEGTAPERVALSEMGRAATLSLLLMWGTWGCAPAGGDAPAEDAPAAGVAARSPSSQERRPPRGSAWVIFGGDTVVAEVARTPEERADGLMYREDVPDGTGMIFVFESLDIRSFWMQNTYVALDIAYMDASYRIVDIKQMEPMTTETHPSAAPAMFALEVRRGWFAEKGVEVGHVPKVVFGL